MMNNLYIRSYLHISKSLCKIVYCYLNLNITLQHKEL